MLAYLRRVRRRLPGDEQFGDPLSRTDTTPAAAVARGLAVLRPERESVASEAGLAALQVWQALSERAGRGRGDIPLALLYTDLVDFSSWALEAGDEAALLLLEEVAGVLEPSIAARGGRIDKRLGDGLIATFLDVPSAIFAALDADDGLLDIEIAGYPPRMRAGVHWGRPRRLGGDYVGADVSLAAVVGGAARGGQVLVSGPALAMVDTELTGLHVGRRKRLRHGAAPREFQVATVRRETPR
jgi:adenylate cyclase